MENTFWNISSMKDGNFVKLFKRSFTLYVEGGMRKKIEADLDILGYEGGYVVTEEFREKFFEIIIGHLLR